MALGRARRPLLGELDLRRPVAFLVGTERAGSRPELERDVDVRGGGRFLVQYPWIVHVAAINITSVKSLGLLHPDAVELTAAGVEANRRFYLRHEGRIFNGKDHGPLVAVRTCVEGKRLSLAFPDGRTVDGEVELGEVVETNFWRHHDVTGRVVEGPWAAALSAYVGKEIALVRVDDGTSAVDIEHGSLVSRASCERLAAELGAEVDPRRFRMLLELDGAGAHEEDGWRDRSVRLGEAVVRVGGPVPRCAITTQDPHTGVVTLDTLRGIKSYRGVRPEDGKSIDFGVYFRVERPGRARVGDPVELV